MAIVIVIIITWDVIGITISVTNIANFSKIIIIYKDYC